MIAQVNGIMRIHGYRTVALATSPDGDRCEITDEQYAALADALKPFAYYESVGWVEEVSAVAPVEWAEVFEVQQ